MTIDFNSHRSLGSTTQKPDWIFSCCDASLKRILFVSFSSHWKNHHSPEILSLLSTSFIEISQAVFHLGLKVLGNSFSCGYCQAVGESIWKLSPLNLWRGPAAKKEFSFVGVPFTTGIQRRSVLSQGGREVIRGKPAEKRKKHSGVPYY